MLSIGHDEDRIRIPAPENVSESARRRERPAFSGERNYFKRVGYWRVPGLIRSPARGHCEMYVAVGSHQKRDLRPALGDSTRGSGKQARRARPLASRGKEQNVQ